MTLVPALDLRTPIPANAPLPANIEAEQALLGCVIYDNSAYERIADNFGPEHFYEPFHGRLWAEMCKALKAGRLCDPILLMDRFPGDKAFEELGGVRYLADMVDRAPPSVHAADYATTIYDLALRRRVIEASEVAKRDAYLGEITGREVIEEMEQTLFSMAESNSQQGFATFDIALAEAISMAAEAFSRDGGLSGISTGLIDVDQRLGGLHPSDLIILAGRPSMGKTALAMNIAYNVAKSYRFIVEPDGFHKTVAGGRVAVFSLEMSKAQLAMRLLADASGIPSDKMRKGEITADEFGRIRDSAELIQSAPLYIDDTGGIRLSKLGARARRLKRTSGLDLIIVDYLQLVTTDGKVDNRVQEVSAITQFLKALAKELNVPIIALSQLSRQVENREDKRPQLSDLRESGSIEQDSDVVAFVYREEYYLGRTEPSSGTPEHHEWEALMHEARGKADLIIGKQRHGPIGTVKLTFNEKLTRFGNLARANIDFAQARLPTGDRD